MAEHTQFQCIDGSHSDSESSDSDASSFSFFDSEHELEAGETLDGQIVPSGAIEEQIQPYQFEPYDSDEEGRPNQNGGSSDDSDDDLESRLINTNWCTCDNCQIMQTPKECICCHQIQRIVENCEDDNPQAKCITEHTDFQAVCLNRGVLDTAYYQYRQQYATNETTKQPHERYRYVAYRQLVRWCWKYLGKDVRRQLPSCAVTVIRETFPSPDGTYTGFKR